MNKRQQTAQTGRIQVLLMGGPPSIPEESRRQLVSPTAERIKLPHRGGYEHFLRDGKSALDEPLMYYWQGRTEIAE